MKCTHCGSKKHGDLSCWKRLICERCGKKGHPAGRFLFVSQVCNKIHDVGQCHMEALCNMIRQWYNPTKHVEKWPEAAERC